MLLAECKYFLGQEGWWRMEQGPGVTRVRATQHLFFNAPVQRGHVGPDKVFNVAWSISALITALQLTWDLQYAPSKTCRQKCDNLVLGAISANKNFTACFLALVPDATFAVEEGASCLLAAKRLALAPCVLESKIDTYSGQAARPLFNKSLIKSN